MGLWVRKVDGTPEFQPVQSAKLNPDQEKSYVDALNGAFKNGGTSSEGIASEGSATIETFITDIKMQTKTKDGKVMKSALYKINAEGTEYKTFSETLAKTAKEAKEAGRKVKITFITTQYGKDAENITFADDGPAPAERIPGEEG